MTTYVWTAMVVICAITAAMVMYPATGNRYLLIVERVVAYLAAAALILLIVVWLDFNPS